MTEPARNPSDRFGQFVGECIGHAGNIIGTLENFVVLKIDQATTNGVLEPVVKKVKDHADKIAQIFFAIGCLYNFYTNATFFLSGAVIGTLASAGPFPASFPSLRQGELLGRTAEDGYAAQKTMFTLAGINYYLGRTYLDDMTFSILAGLITGNTIYHKLGETYPARVVRNGTESLADLTTFVLKTLYIL